MRKCILCFLTLMLTLFASAQNFKKNDVYLEAGGNGFYGSLNYERQIFSKPGLGVRVGTGFFTLSNRDVRSGYVTKTLIVKIPFGVNYLFNLKEYKSFIDAGIGFTYDTGFGLKWLADEKATTTNQEREITAFAPSVGFRHHTKRNFMWRISFTPIINPNITEKYAFNPWAGISFGKRF